MVWQAVIFHAEPEAPNSYDIIRDLDPYMNIISTEPYSTIEYIGRETNATSGEELYMELV